MTLSTDDLVRELASGGLSQKAAELLAGFMQPSTDVPSPVPPTGPVGIGDSVYAKIDDPSSIVNHDTIIWTDVRETVGTSVGIDTGGAHLHFAAAGVYQVHLEIEARGLPDGAKAGIELGAASNHVWSSGFYSYDGDDWYVPIGMRGFLLALPPFHAAAGDYFQFKALLAAGDSDPPTFQTLVLFAMKIG